MTDAGSRRLGIVMVAVSAVLWSTAGLFVRMAHLDAWTMIVWRSVFTFLTLGGFVLLRQRGAVFSKLASLGPAAAFFIGTSVIASISYVVSLRMTTVANVMTIYAALPFIATGIAFVWMRERVTARFLVAGAIAFLGIAVTAGGAVHGRDILGLAAALVMTASFALQLVHTKRHPGMDTALLSALSAGLCVLVAAPFMHLALPSAQGLLACALYGAITTGIAFVLVLEGGRRVTSGEAGFISMLDVVLGPLWVWLAFAERPSLGAIIGGGAVLSAVAWYLTTSRQVSQPAI
ncbi:DMT family transporter [Acidisoma sp. 7E03]